ncbi:hypothetical protein OBBRIDRAFT_803055 [Obba rivulosa]|uniref:Uncharacterized protein n=1 Tax=Obba rivulosa TaxID=1052685 RepID=A0A8E2DMY6_9APHY|nr:hypothetical protein OBBRIDRAFT_803055 [Obba rivulosa]
MYRSQLRDVADVIQASLLDQQARSMAASMQRHATIPPIQPSSNVCTSSRYNPSFSDAKLAQGAHILTSASLAVQITPVTNADEASQHSMALPNASQPAMSPHAAPQSLYAGLTIIKPVVSRTDLTKPETSPRKKPTLHQSQLLQYQKSAKSRETATSTGSGGRKLRLILPRGPLPPPPPTIERMRRRKGVLTRSKIDRKTGSN